MAFINHLDFGIVHAALAAGTVADPTLNNALEIMDKAKAGLATPEWVAAARAEHACDDIEIDDEGAGSSPTDDGVWVQAWVYIVTAEDEEETDDDDTA